jgi:hypothetical protein
MPRYNLHRLSPIPIEALFALEALGQRITQAREARGLSQKEVASMLGIATATYLSIEHGKDSVQIGHYARAVWLLDVPGTFLPAVAAPQPE